MIYILVILWLAIGSSGFIYWWTKDHDLTSDVLGVAIACSIIGPISWIMGYAIHGKHKNVLIKRRKK